MNLRSMFLSIVYFFATIGFVTVFHYGYSNKNRIWPVIFNGALVKLIKPTYETNYTNENTLQNYIDRCPECLLFLLLNQTSANNQNIFNLLNNIPSRAQGVFYPITMKLLYNQPIRFYTILAKNQTELTQQIRQTWINSIDNFQNRKSNSLLDFIYQSLKKSVVLQDYSWSNRTKLLLYYTKFFGSSYWYNNNQREVYSNDFNFNNCPLSVNACHITIDRNLFSESDASLIHIRESINYQQLNNLSRKAHQRFVFFIKESPVHSPVLSSKQHGHLFNYTQTYRPDSDITATTLRTLFWLFDSKVYPNYDFQSILKTKQSNKLLVAIISNCGGSSNRLRYINELKKFVPVDVYGKCGIKCPANTDCRQTSYSKYKFYLAFENSLCEEYVTEKFFFALHSTQIVPIVLGYARYDHYMPTSGYIDVRNYQSPKQLAEYIKYLDGNTTAYLEYFHWRQYALQIKQPKYMCELCLRLFLDDHENKTQTLNHIDQYWNKKNQCISYKPNEQGIWIMK